MNVADAVENITVLQREMNIAADTAAAAAKTYEATMTLYNVAVMTSNKEAIAQRREELHTLLDTILDSGYEVGSKQVRINEIARNVTNE